jgi:hypothetical protein
MFFCLTAYSQSEDIIITAEYHHLDWDSFVEKAENDLGIHFFYNPDSIPKITTSIFTDTLPLTEFLDAQFKDYNIYYSIDYHGNIFLSRNFEITTSIDENFYDYETTQGSESEKIKVNNTIVQEYLNTDHEYIHQTKQVGNRNGKISGSKPQVFGSIQSSEDSSALVQATLHIKELNISATTDDKGNYSFNIDKGKYTLEVSSIESLEKKYKIDVHSDGKLNIWLQPKLFLLDEFVVSSDKNHNVRGAQMGLEKISIKNINEIPVVLGEKDIIKVSLLLPGVQTVGEGSTGFNVRGSPADQNLFYIDDVPVYNTSHLFGFFSAFNADAINEFALYKSNIPLNYGGRLSSIFDIETKAGNQKHFKARGGISPVTGRLMVEGPLTKNKSSYLIGLRSTYSNWILKMVNNPDIYNSKAYFGDAVVNLSFKLSDRDRINLFTYFSYDDAAIANLSHYQFKNQGTSVSWNHLFKTKHNLKLTYASGQYDFQDENTEFLYNSYEQSFQLNHNEIKADIKLRPNENHTISFGANTILYSIDQGDYLPLNEESQISPKTFEPEKGIESGIFAGDQWKINNKLEISGGLRFNVYNYVGPKTVYLYEENKPRDYKYITDTISYSHNEVIKTNTGLDYRFAFKYLITNNVSVKGSYNKLHQYIFLMSNTTAISPNDRWKLSDYHVQPMVGEQFSLGIYKNFLSNYFQTSVEAYFKQVDNLVEYKDGVDLMANKLPETEIIQGDLEAYGLEIMIKKPFGKLNGWVNYTYSRATVIANNEQTGEQNNFGMAYPANWEKPHSFNFVANFKASKRISFSGTLVYSTGRPITYPTSIYYQNDIQITHFSLRNEYRLPDYFRIDAAIHLEGNLLAKKFLHSSLTFSVYNLTGRKNAYSIYFESDNGVIKGYKLSIFGSPIFSITYNFKLGNYED